MLQGSRSYFWNRQRSRVVLSRGFLVAALLGVTIRRTGIAIVVGKIAIRSGRGCRLGRERAFGGRARRRTLKPGERMRRYSAGRSPSQCGIRGG